MAGLKHIDVDTKEVERALRLLDPSKTSRLKAAFRQGTKQSLNMVRTSVRRGAAAVTSERENRTKGVTTRLFKSNVGGSVGINNSFTKSNGRWFGLYLLELGTSEGLGRNGRRHGATPAKPFFAHAVLGAMPRAVESLNKNIVKAIEKVATKK